MTQTTTSRCAHCGAVLAPGARFCPECGRTTSPKASNPLPWIIGGLAGLIIILLLVILLRPPKTPSVVGAGGNGPNGPPVVGANAHPPTGPPITGAQGGLNGPPVVTGPRGTKTPRDPMADALDEYFKKMKVIEDQRKQIAKQIFPTAIALLLKVQIGANGAANIPPDLLAPDSEAFKDGKSIANNQDEKEIQDVNESYRSQIRGLARQVQQIIPPPPARRFHNGYIFSLGSYESVVGQVETALMKNDASSVTQLAQLPSSLEQTLSATNAEMLHICQQYKISPRFTVSDEQGGNILGSSP